MELTETKKRGHGYELCWPEVHLKHTEANLVGIIVQPGIII